MIIVLWRIIICLMGLCCTWVRKKEEEEIDKKMNKEKSFPYFEGKIF